MSGTKVPDLRLLGYHERRPHLRVIRLATCEIVPSPVILDRADAAVGKCHRRDGWIAFEAHQEVWGAPISLEGEAFFVAKSFDCEPGVDPRTVWVAEGPAPPADADPFGPAVFMEYDGVDRKAINRILLPPPGRLEAVIPAGFVEYGPNLREWGASGSRPLANPGHVVASHRSLLAIRRASDLLILDAERGAETLVPNPTGGDWPLFSGSFSPDGRRFAISISVLPDTRTEEDLEQEFAEYVRRWATGEPVIDPEPMWSKLVLVDSADGSVTVADGQFDGLVSTPVWSADGEWLVFSTSERRVLWICRVEVLRLERVRFKSDPPTPLIDVSDLIP